MKPPQNRRVFIVGYGAATPLGSTFAKTWERAVQGDAGFRKVTRCKVESACDIVGEIPDWSPRNLDFSDAREVYNWNAAFVLLTMAVCKEALQNAGIVMDETIAPRMACLIGSALNGTDAFRAAMHDLEHRGPLRVSPYLLPNLCANLPSGKAGMLLKFTGPIFSPQGACASGNHAIGIGARMIRDGDCDFVLAGGADAPILPELIHGFTNMNATIKVHAGDRAAADPAQASRPFSIDRRGFVLSEGAGVVVLAAEEVIRAHGLEPRAEVLGVGWTSDAYHYTSPNPATIVRALRETIADAGLQPADVQYVNAHGTSTAKGDRTEIQCLREVFGGLMEMIPVSSNKSQLGHTLGATAAIEAALAVEGMRRGILLPTINHLPDPEFADIDVVPNTARKQTHEIVLSNAFGFGGTNCCVIFRGV
ncbi:MAG: beta-ketoacyl-[acyl-carrier-protein] synthase family protein [Smithellaceae bacterium]|jgi:3-oxoacyl-[acyl-carrier-protein] synthase II|nr:beta-ketoacyl-[acyl-carrier-protein] synthase family protein [Smithellaceae bacterium]MDD3257952.1 beta-ketoacyl-[acyl-carrier-protein] synthase family protein [Smithellaceae bacterium]MDD3848344.1 beta-ketoacyl-[acyl-carrier-protein] synthase family protein [Smithellaceae bacterium]HOG11493.1 beta-ketoacyl-[acyl-carrier-protein] synthase family protein [Smithellaceae bacterium]HOQ71390.1 beta-ketoacyl-[acyl-carrier-protein] synthase family protein [Smithellaceae bacterium]